MDFKLSVFCALMVTFCTVYSKLIFAGVLSPYWELYDHFCRCLANERAHHRRALLRNIFFNIMRCNAKWVMRYFAGGILLTEERYITQILWTCFATTVIQYCCSNTTQ